MELKKKYREFYENVNSKNVVNKKYYERINDIVLELENKETLEDGLTNLEEELSKITSLKHHYLAAYNRFVRFLINNGYNVPYNEKKDYNTNKRRIELIKFLQEPKTLNDVLDVFYIKERTFNSDKKSIEEGIDFCGYNLKIDISKYNREGNNTTYKGEYRSSCNPVGLALNMTELFILTNVIPEMIKEHEELSKQYNNILLRINSQLSDYAAEAVGVSNKEDIEDFYKTEYEYLEASVINQLWYVKKRCENCIFIFTENGEKKEVEGSVYGIPKEKVEIITKDGEIIKIDFEDYVGIKNFANVYK